MRLVTPGFVRTPLTDKNDFAMPGLMEPEQAAEALELLRRELHPPDVAIAPLACPAKSGLYLCKYQRRDDQARTRIYELPDDSGTLPMVIIGWIA